MEMNGIVIHRSSPIAQVALISVLSALLPRANAQDQPDLPTEIRKHTSLRHHVSKKKTVRWLGLLPGSLGTERATLAIDSNGKSFAAVKDGTVEIWIDGNPNPKSIAITAGGRSPARFLADGALIVRVKGQLILCDTRAMTTRDLGRCIGGLALRPQLDYLITTSYMSMIWDMRSKERRGAFKIPAAHERTDDAWPVHLDQAGASAFSLDGNTLAIGGLGAIVFCKFDPTKLSARPIRRLESATNGPQGPEELRGTGHDPSAIFSICALNGQRFVTGSFDGWLRYWSIDKLERKQQAHAPATVTKDSFHFTVAANSKLISVGMDGYLRVWDTDDGRALDSLPIVGEPDDIVSHGNRVWVSCTGPNRSAWISVFELNSGRD